MKCVRPGSQTSSEGVWPPPADDPADSEAEAPIGSAAAPEAGVEGETAQAVAPVGTEDAAHVAQGQEESDGVEAAVVALGASEGKPCFRLQLWFVVVNECKHCGVLFGRGAGMLPVACR